MLQADQKQGLAAVSPLRREDAGQADPRCIEPPRQGVYICRACGTGKTLRDWIGNVKPLSDWVLVRVYNGDLRR